MLFSAAWPTMQNDTRPEFLLSEAGTWHRPSSKRKFFRARTGPTRNAPRFNYPTLAEAYKVAALDGLNKL